MTDLAYIEAADGSAHAPVIANGGRSPFSPLYGIGGFTWRCVCGARGRRSHPRRPDALWAWDDHFARVEKKIARNTWSVST